METPAGWKSNFDVYLTQLLIFMASLMVSNSDTFLLSLKNLLIFKLLPGTPCRFTTNSLEIIKCIVLE